MKQCSFQNFKSDSKKKNNAVFCQMHWLDLNINSIQLYWFYTDCFYTELIHNNSCRKALQSGFKENVLRCHYGGNKAARVADKYTKKVMNEKILDFWQKIWKPVHTIHQIEARCFNIFNYFYWIVIWQHQGILQVWKYPICGMLTGLVAWETRSNHIEWH